MIANMDVEPCVHKRIVLTCDSNVSYAGVVRQCLPVEGKPGLLLMLDERSGFSIWCPLDFIKKILVVPIADDDARTAA